PATAALQECKSKFGSREGFRDLPNTSDPTAAGVVRAKVFSTGFPEGARRPESERGRGAHGRVCRALAHARAFVVVRPHLGIFFTSATIASGASPCNARRNSTTSAFSSLVRLSFNGTIGLPS